MTELALFTAEPPVVLLETTEDIQRIGVTLGRIGIRYERWPIEETVPAEADQEAILAAYAPAIARLNAEGGYRSADVVRVTRGAKGAAEMRLKFLDEHVHDEDEVRFFVEGAGVFYLHLAGRVYRLHCTEGDLLGVPAGTPHWFDMGPDPAFTAIRLFTNPEGWVARFSGDAIARRIPAFFHE